MRDEKKDEKWTNVNMNKVESRLCKFLNSSSERAFPQLDEFLRKGEITPSFEIHYAEVCLSRESSSKNLQRLLQLKPFRLIT